MAESEAQPEVVPPPAPALKPKKPSIWTRVLNKLTIPKEVDSDRLEYVRSLVKQTQKMEQDRLKRRRDKHAIKKKRDQEKLLQTVNRKSQTATRNSKFMYVPTSSRSSRKTESDVQDSLDNIESAATTPRSFPSLHKQIEEELSGTNDEDEIQFQRYYLDQLGPSHVSAQNTEENIIQKFKSQRKRRISQLYSGAEVYHHSLNIWDHVDSSRFYAILDSETRKKFPLTPKIIKKMDKIKQKREAKVKKKKAAEKKKPCCAWLKHILQDNNLVYVFKTTPRYYRMTPVVPVQCRRCRYNLGDTLLPRWTPLGIIFFLLFPILGILCCVANREFVCVVCEEIYLFGDYPSRSRPLNKSNYVEANENLRLKRRSFKRTSASNA